VDLAFLDITDKKKRAKAGWFEMATTQRSTLSNTHSYQIIWKISRILPPHGENHPYLTME